MVRSMHVGAWLRVVMVVVGAAGCRAFDPSLLDESAPFGEMRGRDSGSSESARDPDACTHTSELCNALDDDCDGKVDEDAESDCIFSHSVGACASAGQCVLADCETGYRDCNMRVQDGCEEPSGLVGCKNGSSGIPSRDAGGDVQVGVDTPPPSSGSDDDAGEVTVTPPPSTDPAPSCVPGTETCNQRDDDCDGKVDEAPADCALDACVAGTPSYRGAACDRCVCQRCGTNLMQCQNNPDANWAMLCRDVTECYVTNSRANMCGTNEDCYGTGNGPCAAEINLASGGSSATDGSKAATACRASTTPDNPCAAVTQYRDQCVRDLCMTECAE